MIDRQPISFRRLFLRHHLWIPLIPLAAGLVFSLVGWALIGQANRLERQGVDAVAVVTARDIRTETDRDGTRRTHHFVGYRFQPAAGQTVTARDRVARSTYDSVEVGQTVPVRYLPDDPSVSRLAAEGSGRGGAVVLGLFGFLLLAGSLGATALLLRGKLSAIRAARRGEVREAEVIDHVPTNVSVNGRTQYRYRWIDARREQGQSGMMDFARLPDRGAVVRVYIDPVTGRGWSEHDY